MGEFLLLNSFILRKLLGVPGTFHYLYKFGYLKVFNVLGIFNFLEQKDERGEVREDRRKRTETNENGRKYGRTERAKERKDGRTEGREEREGREEEGNK